jgi:anti-anti-sigma regulatory factor
MPTSALTWKIARHGEITVVEFHGDLDETAYFAELKTSLAGTVSFDLADVRRIDSAGIREWISLVRELDQVEKLVFVRCSPQIVTHLNMIFNFAGPATIASFMAPFICPACDHEEEQLIDVARDLAEDLAAGRMPRMPAFACRKCNAAMELDDVADRYTYFLT